MQPAIISAASGPNTVNPFVPSAPPPEAFFIWSAVWLAVVLASGMLSFQYRDV
jgi:hypothetical protein